MAPSKPEGTDSGIDVEQLVIHELSPCLVGEAPSGNAFNAGIGLIEDCCKDKVMHDHPYIHVSNAANQV